MLFRTQVREMLKNGEGSIPWMYLDTVGKVTVGVGNMLPNVSAAQALAFVDANGAAASAVRVAGDFRAVSSLPAGKVARVYKHVTTVRLTEAGINDLLDGRITEFETGLRRLFPDYDDFPDPARMGILDMAFNLGLNGLDTKFPSFCRNARNRDWQGCAQQCHRRGISDARN
ncbi:MAG: hypothetical protein KDI42_09970, partial [Gammaproteobacteria bacterium]|nr:hypothetical protein [Gammaproteobacteria bacterium]